MDRLTVTVRRKIFAVLSLLLWVGGNSLLFVSLQYTIAIRVAGFRKER